MGGDRPLFRHPGRYRRFCSRRAGRDANDFYSPYHEISILAFHEEFDRRYRRRHPETRLKELRKASGLTRDALAALAQVSSRLIEQYEQRRRDINAARADSFLNLAQALNCDPAALIERVPKM